MSVGMILGTAANAVLPILLLILTGYLLRQKRFFSDDFLKTGNKLVFNVGIPCLLFVNVYGIDGLGAIRWDIVIYALAATFLIFLLSLLTAVRSTSVPERKGVLLQCAFRSNFAIIGLTLAGILGGEPGMAVASVLSAFAIPLFNILGVVSLSIFVDSGQKNSVRGILLNILKNPLILGVLAGFAALGLRGIQVSVWGRVVFSLKEDLKFVYTALTYLKAMTSPLALIVLGGQFRFSAVGGMLKEIAVGTVWRIVLAPVLGIGGAIVLSRYGVLSCTATDFPALIALFGSPVAVSSAVMAGAMGNDEQLATQLVVWTSIGSVVTIFLQVCILMAAGFLTA